MLDFSGIIGHGIGTVIGNVITAANGIKTVKVSAEQLAEIINLAFLEPASGMDFVHSVEKTVKGGLVTYKALTSEDGGYFLYVSYFERGLTKHRTAFVKDLANNTVYEWSGFNLSTLKGAVAPKIVARAGKPFYNVPTKDSNTLDNVQNSVYNNNEQNNVSNNVPSMLPEEYKPISMWSYFGYGLLFSIPYIGASLFPIFAFGTTQNMYSSYKLLFSALCIGSILLLVIGAIILLEFAFGKIKNINVCNFARSYFCVPIIVLVIAVVFSPLIIPGLLYMVF